MGNALAARKPATRSTQKPGLSSGRSIKKVGKRVTRAAPAPGLTRRELAEAMHVVMMTVTKWEARGMPVLERGRRGKPSYYDLEACERWKADAERQAQSSSTVDVAHERARRERAQAVLAEQTFQMRSSELLPRVEVERVWEAEVIAVRAKLLQIPPTFADRVYQAAIGEGVMGVERVLVESVNDVLRELAGEGQPEAHIA